VKAGQKVYWADHLDPRIWGHAISLLRLWHKIELASEVGKSNLYRPTFRNMLCFGRGKMSAGQATADVVPPSKRLYEMAFGFEAAKVCVEFCKRYTNRVCDPFCGQGTVLHVAEELGMDSVGVDIDPKVCEVAETFAADESARSCRLKV
jgi:2-polyprenyl-3-methyl-5-hydroxy-6-metoxy-1,4-benzoquinol methylase